MTEQIQVTTFRDLPEADQAEFLAQVLHVIMHDTMGFGTAKSLISYGRHQGLFDRVKFGREITEDRGADGKTGPSEVIGQAVPFVPGSNPYISEIS